MWYQSYEQIDEQELIDKWNEANKKVANSSNDHLSVLSYLDEGDPGFEPNHEVEESDIEDIHKFYQWIYCIYRV